MKTIRPFRVLAALFLSSVIVFSCQKSDLDKSSAGNENTDDLAGGMYRTAIQLDNGNLVAGGVTLTAPTVVNINQNFNIIAQVSCGRVALERAYILGPNDVKIYHNLTCGTPDLQWEEVVTFKCYTEDINEIENLAQVGTYVYRTKHNASDGNCDGLGGGNRTGDCSFNGNEFYCFTVEAINPCQTEFTGEAISCDDTREAVYKFTSFTGEDYIKIQGGLTNFTGADAEVIVSGGNLTVSQRTPGGSSNRVITVEGSVPSCQEITITIRWNSSNGGSIITGEWSVKDENGVDVAPSIAGLTCQ